MPKKRPVKSATFNGRRYMIDIDPDGVDGMCDQYACNERYLHIFTDLNTQKGLITTIHEVTHGDNWRLSEDMVDRLSKDLGRFLWRLGYRIGE